MIFSRAWPFLDRVFRPSSGNALELPNVLAPVVVPTCEPLRYLHLAGGRFRLYGDATVVGAGTTVVPLSAPRELTHVPVLLSVLNPDAAARTILVEMLTSGVADAPTGRWPVTGAGSVVDERVIGAGLRAWFHAPVVPPGAQLQIRYQGMTGGVATSALYWFLEVPSESLDLATATHVSAT